MITLDANSAVSASEQIRLQLAGQITGKTLVTGARLPTVRSLAADLGVPPATVGRAYTELERAGLITTGRRQGSRVAAPGDTQREQVARAARDLVRDARGLGMSDGEISAVVSAAF